MVFYKLNNAFTLLVVHCTRYLTSKTLVVGLSRRKAKNKEKTRFCTTKKGTNLHSVTNSQNIDSLII